MTVEAAVLNSSAVAIAADSACSFGDKVFYSAEKIFRLHKDLPVGVMVFSSATYMGEVDWPVLLKEYAKDLNGKSFPTLYEHAKDFINYVEKFKYITDEMVSDYYGKFVMETVNYVLLGNVKKKFSESQDTPLSELIDEVLREETEELEKNEKINGNLKLVDIDSLEPFYKHKYLEDDIVGHIKQVTDVEITESQMDALKKLVHRITIAVYMDEKGGDAKYFLTHQAGIVFVGYGETELFPSYSQHYVYGQLGTRFVCHEEKTEKIHEVGNGGIIPFAQSDVINLFKFGIDPRLKHFIYSQIGMFSEVAAKMIPEEHLEMFETMRGKIFMNIEKFIRDEIYLSMMSVISNLPGADMAEIAEALVNMTSIKRRNSHEDETVGGPTDVALITKGDGFRWIKNKDSSKVLNLVSRF
jgi:hypothetical protein